MWLIIGTGKDGGILPRSLDMLFDHIKGRQYQGMDLKPHVGDVVLKLDNNQTRQEEAIKSAIFSSQREVMFNKNDSLIKFCNNRNAY